MDSCDAEAAQTRAEKLPVEKVRAGKEGKKSDGGGAVFHLESAMFREDAVRLTMVICGLGVAFEEWARRRSCES
ncbi:hypothetical protein TYRP_005011 [Tyrophagus putrescentiae]|nr:hypothetical protein TYRP_005011 [Tyrophagus putrescentiae]